MVIDTGASHSVIDLNVLLILGYAPRKTEPLFEFETAAGLLKAAKFQLPSLTVFDRRFLEAEIFFYDFISLGLVGDYDGVVGLDILKVFTIHFDFPKNQIRIL